MPAPPVDPPQKEGLHPRNRHRGRYDFPALIQTCQELGPFVAMNQYNDLSIDFADPQAVKALNRALLKHHYGVSSWDLPEGYLCPPIPGRADYLHHIADLLAEGNGGRIPQGAAIRVLDIGVGANCIYPLLGHSEYGWSFLGSEVDATALASAQKIVRSNRLEKVIELRRQPSPSSIFSNILQKGERFDLSICNPPFHASLEESQEGTRRKLKNLGLGVASKSAPALNFGGQNAELWCPGGEAAFVSRMIQESVGLPGTCYWFSTLISKESNLPGVLRELKKVGVLAHRTLPMAQGQKRSRIVAWTFLNEDQRKDWRRERWRMPATEPRTTP